MIIEEVVLPEETPIAVAEIQVEALIVAVEVQAESPVEVRAVQAEVPAEEAVVEDIVFSYADERKVQAYWKKQLFCTEYMKELDADEDSKYTIISFDLNNLKKTNDQYGHVQGDLLIKKAAELIDEIFSGSGIVGRIGGDEFIAILSTEDTTYVEALLEQMKKRIDETNRIITELNLSISYGYAMRNEIEENITEKVYQLSDNRMYEYKRIYKQQHEE